MSNVGNAVSIIAYNLNGAPISPEVIDKINREIVKLAKSEQIAVSIQLAQETRGSGGIYYD